MPQSLDGLGLVYQVHLQQVRLNLEEFPPDSPAFDRLSPAPPDQKKQFRLLFPGFELYARSAFPLVPGRYCQFCIVSYFWNRTQATWKERIE